MRDDNRELLDEVIKSKLEKAKCEGDDEHSESFDEAMKAIDRRIELLKVEASIEKDQEEIELKKVVAENEYNKNEAMAERADAELILKKKDCRWGLIIKALEIGAIVIVAPIIDKGAKKAFARMICEFEKDYTFTTHAGRSLSGLFRFKK